MTANAGKGADGKRPTGADAKGGRPRKKTSAAKPPRDEVTVRTNDGHGTNGIASQDDTVIDVPVTGDASRDTASEIDDDATMIDAIPDFSSSSSSSSSSSEERSGRTATFGLPKDLGNGSGKSGSGEAETDDAEPDTWSAEPAAHDDATKFPQESGESMPSSGRSASMDASTSSSGDFGGSTSPDGATGAAASRPSGTPQLTGGAPPSYAPAGPGRDSASGRQGAGKPSRVAKVAGAIRRPDPKTAGGKSPRKAQLQVARFEPWSVMKFSFVMSLVGFLVLFIAVTVLYVILSSLGVFDALSNTIHDLTSNDQGKSGGLNPASWFSAARILGYTALIGALNVLLITALATVWSVIYNMIADLVGGVEVTLTEAD